jgi:hypothetical protein
MEWYWHIHHDILCEPLIGMIKDRIHCINTEKPECERATRLRLLRPVQHPDRLPIQLVEARKAYDEAWKAYGEAGKAYGEAGKAYGEAGKAYDEAWKAYGEAGKACAPELERLHREECPGCPWDGYTIFPVGV